jgi:hypothetical protein
MIKDRIVGALLFRRRVYAETAEDGTFTRTAWILAAVCMVTGLSGLLLVKGLVQGGRQLLGTVVRWSIHTAVLALVTHAAGTYALHRDSSFARMTRVLNLTHVWSALAFLDVLSYVSGPVGLLASLLVIARGVCFQAARVLAIKEGLRVGWVQSLLIYAVGFVILLALTALPQAISFAP